MVRMNQLLPALDRSKNRGLLFRSRNGDFEFLTHIENKEVNHFLNKNEEGVLEDMLFDHEVMVILPNHLERKGMRKLKKRILEREV